MRKLESGGKSGVGGALTVEKIADRLGFLVRQAAADDRPRDIFGRRLGDVQVGGESFFQRAVGAAVARLTSLGAANDEQQFVQRVFEVVVVEVAVAGFQCCCNVPNGWRVFWRNHVWVSGVTLLSSCLNLRGKALQAINY